MSDFAELLRIVVGDPALMESFTSARSEAELFAMAIALGGERGLSITAAELRRAVVANRQAWLERWIPF